MNRQAIFDRIAKHLLKQNARSIHTPGDDIDADLCAYRQVMADGTVRKCAIGCLIPDKNYDPMFEGQNIYAAGVRGAIPAYLRVRYDDSVDDVNFLAQIQDIHDRTDVKFWRKALEGFAYRHGLDASVVT